METAPHIHVLISPRFYNEKRKRYELSSNKYFGTKKDLVNWQTKYADHMHKEFNNLIRGIRGSKQSHISLKKYYALLGEKMNENNKDSVLAYAKYGYLAEKKIRMLENTVSQLQEDERYDKLLKRVENAEKATKEYKEVTKEIQKQFNIKDDDVIEIIDKIQASNFKGREK